MSWITGDLSGILTGVAGAAASKKTDLSGLLTIGSSTLGKVQDKVNALSNGLNVTQSVIDHLAVTGVHALYLSPGAGDWAARATSESGAPPNLGYSAGVVLVVTADNLAAVAAKYDAIYQVLTTPF